MEKKLKKSKDRRICGVCGGIAEYFNVDPTLVRIGTALLVCCYGIGIIPYFIAALIMPNCDE